MRLMNSSINPYHTLGSIWLGMLLMSGVNTVLAAPQGGEVVAGSGSISQVDSQTTQINQQSNSMSINWDSFNVAQDELVQFIQPGRDSVSLNHILDQHPSQIFGRIDANGKVFLMNPNGMIFGETARINVGGLVAGAFTLDNADFSSGNLAEILDIDISQGSVINAGVIQGLDGASIALLGNHVSNTGTINARLGKIQLLSADRATLSFDHDGLIQFSVDEETLENISGEDSAVINSGTLQANSGYVVMEAAAANSVFVNVVNNSGVIHADRIVNEGGVVRLVGSGGNVLNSGDITANGTAGNRGGEVSLMGDRVGVLGTARIDVSGDSGGGQIAIGGYRRGAGDQTAAFTQVSRDAQLRADAINSGNGGEITVWADDTAWVYGDISARGGANSGDGGFVEISGKQGLVLDATVDTRAPYGQLGTLLIDPTDIVIHDQADGAQGNDGALPDLSDGTVGAGAFDIGELALEGLAASSNLILEATNNITINDLADNNLNLAINNTGSVTMTADSDASGTGDFTMNSGDTITTQGAAVNISGATVTVGDVTTDAASDGAIQIASSGSASVGNLNAGTSTVNVSVDSDADGTESLTVTGTLTGGTRILAGGIDGSETLIGPNVANTWTITGLNSGTLNGASYSNFTDLQGGTNNDTFTVTGIGNITGLIDGATHATADTINYSGASGIVSVAIGTDFTNIESITGGGADFTLIGQNVVNTWTLTGENDGTVAGISFTDFSNLSGGTNTDNFVLSGGSATGTLAGNAGTDSLTANNVANVWNILSTDGGNVDGVFAFTGIENLTGGTGTDSYFISGGTVTGTIDGGNGLDTIAPANVTNTWNITGADQGNVTGIGSFVNVENLNGRNNTDNFIFADGASISGSIDGGAGTDSVDQSAQSGAITINLANGDYANIETYLGNNNAQLIGNNIANTWTINSAFDGSNDGTLGGITFVDFNNLTGGSAADIFILSGGGTLSGTIDGGGGTDTLRGDNVSNTWNITGADAGDVTGIGDFQNIENLTGNALVDNFVFADGSTISGAIDGGGNTDSVDLSAETGAVSVTLGATGYLNIEAFVGNGTTSTLTGDNIINTWTLTGADSGTVNTTNFSGFNNLTGGTNSDSFTINGGSLSGTLSGGAGTDTLIGDNSANTWNITGADAGNVNGVTIFTGIENLTGNASTDDYIFANLGTISGIINGAGNTDTINYSAKLGAVAVDLSGAGFSNIEAFIGNNTNSTLTGINTANTWTVTGVNDGTLNTISFTDFNNLVGSDNTDNFVINGGSVTGSITGGLGTDTLTGDNSGDSWTITGADVGSSGDVASFNTLETLIGGSGTDNFAFNNSATFSGLINGGAGTDTVDQSAQLGVVSIDLAGSIYTSIENFVGNNSNSTLVATNMANVWTVTGANSGTVNSTGFSGFNNITGNAATDQFTVNGGSISGSIDGAGGTDTLIADNTVNTWNISGANTGDVTGVGSFSNLENITGGSLADNMVFANASSISGIVDGGAGSDTANFSLETGAVSITIGAAAFTNIESYIGNNTSSTLIGPSGANTWTITGNNDGSVGSVNFTNFNNLSGNISTDSFLFQTGGSITGQIDGGAGIDSLNYSADAGIVSVDLSSGNFINVESFIGNNTNSTLIGANSANTWNITGNNDGIVGTASFTDFNNLTGGTAADNFTLNGGAITGTINGGTGTDTLTGNNVANSWVITATNTGSVTDVNAFASIENLIGNSSTDDFTFNDGGDITGSITGGNGIDSVDQSAQSGLVSVTLGASGYSDIESFVGNGTNSTLTGDDLTNTWNITGVDSGTVSGVSFSNFSNLMGGAQNDSFVLSGGSISGQVSGGTGTDQITAATGSNTWNITGVNVGSLTGISAFTGIETLTGNTGSDNYVFANGSSFSGLINGDTGSDTVDFSSQVGVVSVTMSSSSYLNIEQFIGNSTNSTLIAPTGANTWTITGTDSGLLNSIAFSDFNNLLGNTAADTFSLEGGTITGVVDGGSGNDTIIGDSLINTWTVTSADAGAVTGINAFQNIDNLTGNSTVDTFNINDDLSGTINGEGGDDIININALVSIGGTLVGGTGTDSLNGPNLDSTWLISAADSGTLNGNSFNTIEDLNGGSAVDTFTITNATTASASGTLDGGAGDDIFNITYSAAANRSIDITGGTGTDILQLSGSATGLENSYVYGPATDAVTISSTGTVWTQTVSASEIESIEDTMSADRITLTGSTGADNMTLSPGSIAGSQPTHFEITGFLPTEFSNKTDLTINGGAGSDSLTVNGSVIYGGDITLSAETIVQGTAGLLGADTLTFNQATNIGTSLAPIETEIDSLIINGPTTNAYILETDFMAIAADTVSGILDIETIAGDITSAGPVIVTGNAVFTVADGRNITLNDDGNLFSGAITFASAGTINDLTLVDNSAVDLHALTLSGNLDLTTDGNVTQSGALLIEGDTLIDAGANAITLNSFANDFEGTVSLTNSGNNNVAILDQNVLQFAESSLGSGSFTVTAGSITQSDKITQQANAGTTTITAQNGSINLNDSGNDFTGTVILINNAGAATVLKDGNTLTLGSSDTNGGNLNVTAGSHITLTGTTVSDNGNITLISTNGNILLGRLNAGTGTIVLNAEAGSIVGNNSQITDPNLTAQHLDVNGGDTIGEFTNPISVNISGTSKFVAGDGSANIIGNAGTILPGSVLVNNVAFTTIAIGQGQSVSYIVANQDEDDVLQDVPLYSTVNGGVHLPSSFETK